MMAKQMGPVGTVELFMAAVLYALYPICEASGDYTYAVVDTGQTKCYGNRGEIDCPRPGEAFYGQDANYDGPEPSYRDNGDGTITDLNTGLMWQKAPTFEHYTWDDARRYAEQLVLAGHDDWRLPTIKEFIRLLRIDGRRSAQRVCCLQWQARELARSSMADSRYGGPMRKDGP